VPEEGGREGLRLQVEGSSFGGWNRESESVNFATARRGHTTGVLVFAGMKGNPFGGLLFNHVAFFKGESI
jgi:hypothetical protein